MSAHELELPDPLTMKPRIRRDEGGAMWFVIHPLWPSMPAKGFRAAVELAREIAAWLHAKSSI